MGWYDVVHWIDAESSESCRTSFGTLARDLKLYLNSPAEQSLAKVIYSNLAKQRRKSLLIFDNITDPRNIQPWLPDETTGFTCHCDVLASSRSELDPLVWGEKTSLTKPEEDMRKLIRSFAGKPELPDEDCRLFIEAFDSSNLALLRHAVGRWRQGSPVSVEKFCQQVRVRNT